MTKSELKKRWPDIFSYRYLINLAGVTLLAATVKKASVGSCPIAYLPETGEHIKLDPAKIICTVKTKPRPAE